MNQRIDEFQLPAAGEKQATFLRHLPLKHPGNLAFTPDGTLLALSDGQVVTVPLKEGEAAKVLVSRDKLEKPAGLAVDADGLLYLTDCGPQVVKVFDPATGAPKRTIGTPGGAVLGPWDPARFDNPVAVAVDGCR